MVEPLEPRCLFANLSPLVEADSYSAREGGTLTVVASDGVLANDVDPEGTRLTAEVLRQPRHGTVRLRPNGAFEYFHDGSETIADRFTYVVTDANGKTSTGRVDFAVRPVNDAPVAARDGYLVTGDKLKVEIAGGVLANDTDADQDPLKARLIDEPKHGRVVLRADGSFVYAPDDTFRGADYFTYRATDGTANSGIVRVTLVEQVQIADDADRRFSLTGSWSHHPLVGIREGGRYRQAGNGAHQATWTLDVIPGLYRVSATWKEAENRARNAPFTILDGTAVRSTVHINQERAPRTFRDRGAMWEDLGDPVFIDGHTLRVQLTNAADQYVVADAIRVERLDSPNTHRVTGRAGTSFVTRDGRTGIWGSDTRHHYATDQPFNANGSLLWVENRGPGSVLRGVVLDTKDGFEVYTALDLPPGSSRWDPRRERAFERIVVTSKSVQWVDVRTLKTVQSWDLPFAHNDLTGKGNPSADGKYLPLLGDRRHAYILNTETGEAGPAFDLKEDCGLSSCTPLSLRYSPDGRHLLVGYPRSNWRLLDVDLTTLRIRSHRTPTFPADCPDCSTGEARLGFLAPKLGHPDFVVGKEEQIHVVGQSRSWTGEVITGVGAVSADGRLGSVLAFNVATGTYFSPTAPQVDGIREGFAQHVSGQAYGRPGWVYVTYLGGPSEAGKRYAGEVVAIQLSTGKVQRLGTHRSTSVNCYRCEPHAVPSRDGRSVVFASNWGADPEEVAAYVIDAS